MSVRYITNKSEVESKREIVSIQASDLMDTEYFVKMKPFIEMEMQNK